LAEDEPPEDAAFRRRLRAWLHTVLPAVWGGANPPGVLDDDAEMALRKRFDEAVHQAGWSGISWPVAYGGRGGSQSQEVIFAEECAEARAPERYNRVALGIAAPALLAYGSDEQKLRYLPRMLDCSEVWCQGFSEPDAGSDLAGLRTRAANQDGRWLITGQKTWTTLATVADYCFLLARSSTEPSRHRGITAFILPLHQPGISIRPLRQINSSREFSEVFYDAAVAADSDVIGEVGQGWEVAMHALGFERSTNLVHRQIRLGLSFRALLEEARQMPAPIAPGSKDRLARLAIRVTALKLTVAAHLAAIEKGGAPGIENNATKVYWSDAYQELGDLALELGGLDGLLKTAERPEWSQLYLASLAATIYAGTSEIQKNIIAERGLGLPR
jgi:alkylation response protein AidB-like acyl-CoA dehydrogenase